jgi:uncharacterized protein (TIGR03086 family)
VSEIANLWMEMAGVFTARLEGVRDDQWDAPTPCSEWSVRDLAGHAVAVQRQVAEGKGLGIPDPETDPAGAWAEVGPALEAAIGMPGALDRTIELPSGEIPAWGPPFGDIVVHTWDLARAIGADEQLPPRAVEIVYEALQPADEMVRSSGIMGPKIEPPAGADPQTRLLCFTGRTV